VVEGDADKGVECREDEANAVKAITLIAGDRFSVSAPGSGVRCVGRFAGAGVERLLVRFLPLWLRDRLPRYPLLALDQLTWDSGVAGMG
jgi:hypothetical protein